MLPKARAKWKTNRGIGIIFFLAGNYQWLFSQAPMSIIYKNNYGTKLSKKSFIVKTLSIHIDASPASLSHCFENISNHSCRNCPAFSHNRCSELHKVNWSLVERNIPNFVFRYPHRKKSGIARSEDRGGQFTSPCLLPTLPGNCPRRYRRERHCWYGLVHHLGATTH